MKIQQKRSSALDNGAAKKPTSAQTEYGELCVNFNEADPSLFIRDTNDEIRKIGGDLSLYQLKTEVGASVIISETKPIVDSNGEPVQSGELWYCSSTEDEGGGRLYVYYVDDDTSQWVDTSLPGTGTDFGQAEAEGLFLSKVNDDTAAGDIKFEGLTTHEGGIIATGGTSIRAIFDTTTPNWGGNQSAKFYASGNSNQNGNQGFTANDIGPGTAGDAVGFYYQENSANSTHNNYGFKANVLANAGTGENYAFYSEGNAPSFFRGVTEHEGGIKLPNITNAGTLGTDADGNIIVGSGTGAGDLWTENAGAIYPTTLTNNVGIGMSTEIHQRLCITGIADDTINETTGTVKFQANNGNGLLFGTQESSPFQSYIQSAFLGDSSVAQYGLLLNPLGGNVGIMTSDPAGSLNVQSNTAAGPSLTYDSHNVLNLDYGIVQLAVGIDTASPFGGYLQARDNTNGARALSLNPVGGNVGINTQSPGSSLEVNGESYLRGNAWLGRHKNAFPGNNNDLPGCFAEDNSTGTSLFISRTDNTPLVINTNIDTGIVRFRKGGVEKGNISIDDNGTTFWGKLSGLQADQFLRSDVEDIGSGRITLEGGQGTFGSSTSGVAGAFEVRQNESTADAFMAFHIAGKYAAYFGLDSGTSDLFYGGWSVGPVRHRVAHGGNLDHFPVVRTDGANQTVNGEKSFTNATFFTNGITFHDQGLCFGTRNTAAFPGVDNIDIGGRLHVSADSGGFAAISRKDGEPVVFNRTGTNGNLISCRKNGAAKGGIEVNDANIIITGQASDYRIKKDITPMPSAVEDIKAMRLINFVYTDRGHGETHEGFIAHELQEIVPGAVTRHKDALDRDGKPDLQGIDFSKLIPKLTKALQETIAKNEELEARIAALEGA